MKSPSITDITVTLNCAGHLQELIDSLLTQTDQDFDWTVMDGGSTDDSVAVASRFPAHRTTIESRPDFGIYDALNKAVKRAQGDYYLVVGADDRLDPQAIANFRRLAAESCADIVAAKVATGTGVLRPMRGWTWLRGGNAFVASHSVGSLIRRDLHLSCGYYSNRYINAADMHFVLKAVRVCDARVVAGDFIAGMFSESGISSRDRVCSLSDAFRIQLAMGANVPLQLALYTFRLINALLLSRATKRPST